MREAAKLRRGEMGLERLCVFCGEYWPIDDEFWFVLTDGRLHSYCKACCTQRRGELRNGGRRKIQSAG